MLANRRLLLMGGGVSFSPLLGSVDNVYGAFGVKRLLSTYSGALLRLRRSSDDAESDFSARSDGWLNVGAVNSWLGGASGLITTLYDQTGNSRNFAQSTAASQPTLNLSGTRPTIEFDGSNDFFDMAAGGMDFARNVGAVSLLAVRKADAASGTHSIIAISTGAGTARVLMQHGANNLIGGRRNDADAFTSITGVAADTSWRVHIGRLNYSSSDIYHNVDSLSNSSTSFLTDGVTQDTASTSFRLGRSTGGGTDYFDGQMTAIALVRDFLTNDETAALITSGAALKAA